MNKEKKDLKNVFANLCGDAFTNKAFKGNPAAVCLTSDPLDDVLMQNIAAEMNLSETA